MCVTQHVPCPACLNPDTLPPGYPGQTCGCQVCGYQWKPGPILEIDGKHPAEYAALWGSDTGESRAFYACSEQAGPGRVIANTGWSPDHWRKFVWVARMEAARIRFKGQTVDGRAEGWTLEDAGNLQRLARWAKERIDGPQRFTYTDSSGRELFRATEHAVALCGGSGDQTANVESILPDIEWLGSAEDIRQSLKQCGAWDADELADDEANRTRILWVGLSDIAEYPQPYAD